MARDAGYEWKRSCVARPDSRLARLSRYDILARGWTGAVAHRRALSREARGQRRCDLKVEGRGSGNDPGSPPGMQRDTQYPL